MAKKKVDRDSEDAVWVHSIDIQQHAADATNPQDQGDIVQIDLEGESQVGGSIKRSFAMSLDTARKFAQDFKGHFG